MCIYIVWNLFGFISLTNWKRSNDSSRWPKGIPSLDSSTVTDIVLNLNSILIPIWYRSSAFKACVGYIVSKFLEQSGFLPTMNEWKEDGNCFLFFVLVRKSHFCTVKSLLLDSAYQDGTGDFWWSFIWGRVVREHHLEIPHHIQIHWEEWRLDLLS